MNIPFVLRYLYVIFVAAGLTICVRDVFAQQFVTVRHVAMCDTEEQVKNLLRLIVDDDIHTKPEGCGIVEEPIETMVTPVSAYIYGEREYFIFRFDTNSVLGVQYGFSSHSRRISYL